MKTCAVYLKHPAEANRKSDSVSEYVAEILEDVKLRGDEAVRKYSLQFDGWSPEDFRVSENELIRAAKVIPETLKEDLKFSYEQIKNFAAHQLASVTEFERETLPGVFLGQKLIPIQTVGAYVPGGRYPLMCSALMSITTAKVAGVERVVACSPPAKGEGINPKILYAMSIAGADEILSVGGIQAIGALAYGTQSIPAVDKIVGPGNRYVAEAKRLVQGQVGIEFIAGPSEILVLADETANPALMAADLIAQAEHDPYARAILVSTSEKVARATMVEVEKLLDQFEDGEVARTSWETMGSVAIVPGLRELVSLANDIAAEHVHVHMAEPNLVLRDLYNYGSLFLGEDACVVFSDKAIGTNHILPTSRTARYTGGVSVFTFLKVVTYQRLDKLGVEKIAPVAKRLSLEEGLKAHARAAELRMSREG